MSKGTRKLLTIMLVVLILDVAAILVLLIVDKSSNKQTTAADGIEVAVIEPTSETEAETTTEPVTEEPTTTEPTEVDLPNEKPVRFFAIDGSMMRLVTEYRSTWSQYSDIAIFEAFNSDEDEFYYSDYYTIHEELWNSVETDTVYRIGYELTLVIDGETRVYTILEPQDITDEPDLFMGDADYDEVTGYMGVWVYCDIGQTGTYVHVSQSEYTPNTLLTSIKLRPTPQSDAVSECRLKVFSYSSDEEFNSEGHYIGTHGYEIPIINE